MATLKFISFILIAWFFSSCSEPGSSTLFERLNGSQTNISFSNDLIEQEGLDVFRYRNYYNGAGVGIGDFNKDGLSDVYFVANQKTNRLYLNKGGFKFEDVTDKSGAGGTKPWSTGVTIADVNGDGWLDIYVSNSGDPGGTDRANELFINNHDGTFAEQAEEFGLADSGFTTHAAFFDFDNDGDLDCYVLNNSFRPVSTLQLTNTRDVRDYGGGDRFYENRDGKFVDVSEEVGIYGSVIAFGLSVTLVDANIDGWTDIYISNDFFERDYLYINQKGERFSEELEQRMDQISLASMGADAEDLNNDGLPEIFVTEMLPEESQRLKQVTSFESFAAFDFKKRQGFYNQFQHNTLQLNVGEGRFIEISRYANVAATDWSWGALMFDMNNDGHKEIFVTNGIYKDVTDQDFLEYFGSEENLIAAQSGSEIHFEEFVERMPSTPIPNYVFALDSLMIYENKAQDWGLDTPSFSNGSAYGDLDNDGDLDLVVNNLNQTPFIYRNDSGNFDSNHYLKVDLKGDRKNVFGIGAVVTAFTDSNQVTVHHYPSRGFQSSVDHQLLLGLGEASKIDSLIIQWDHNRNSKYYNLPVDTLLEFSVTDVEQEEIQPQNYNHIFQRVPFDHKHTENNFNDFTQSGLIFHKLSMEGPPVAVSDVNNDGLDDFYIGGATGFPGSLYQNAGGNNFEKVIIPVFEQYAVSEEVDAVFFDADNDGDSDLYVVSGGNELGSDQRKFADQLYINEGVKNGEPVFSISNELPRLYLSGSCVRPADFDRDGDIDLFVGSRSIPGEYGKPADSHILENDGNGNFTDVTAKFMTQLKTIGMVTDATWTDYDNDDDLDLIIVGEWMPITLFENRGNFFQRQFDVEGLTQSEGWWKSITPYDINDDGNMDFVAGNLGTNSMFKASVDSPVKLYVNDFDRNGTLDHVYTFKKGDDFIPYHLKGPLGDQLSFINARFKKHTDYADKTMTEIFSKEELQGAIELTANQLASVIIINHGDGSFEMQELPQEAQYSPIFDVIADDFNTDGKEDLLLVGNFSGTRPEEGYYDANHGLLFEIDRAGKLSPIEYNKTGLWIRGDVRDVHILESSNGKLLLIGKNNDQAEMFSY